MSLYPLLFQPRYLEKIWGGRRIETALGKTLPAGKLIGESWELFDFPPGVVDDSSDWVSATVINGRLAGQSLHQLVQEYGPQLHGDVALVGQGQFPILIKFLDARQDLSVQVHPSPQYAKENPESHLKTEAWYVMEHEPDARILKGLMPGVTRQSFEQAVRENTVEQQIQPVTVRQGDCHFLPSGTVHALGAGILAAEVQTPSDTTFRVYDFNRLENGQPRKLHITQALECIDFVPQSAAGQSAGHEAQRAACHFANGERLVASPFFHITKVGMSQHQHQPITYERPVVWIMLEGAVEITVKGQTPATRIVRGQTVLLPAAMNQPHIRALADSLWLEVTFP